MKQQGGVPDVILYSALYSFLVRVNLEIWRRFPEAFEIIVI